MDVKTTFLNGVIEEEVYIEQPPGFDTHDKKTHVCQLKRALYGLKQAPIAWYERIDDFLMSLALPKLKYILASTIRLKMTGSWYYYCMYMIYFLQERRISSMNVRRIL